MGGDSMCPDMANVTRAGHHRSSGGRFTGAFVVAVVVAVVSGLVWMHALGGGHHRHTASHAGHGQQAADDVCTGHDTSRPCPTEPGNEHPVCQSGPVTGSFTIAEPQPVGWPEHRSSPVDPVSAALAVSDGSGCGPPSLTMLSISRT